MNVRELSEKFQDEIVVLRREFHQNPELSWQEFKTAARIEQELNKIGIDDIKRIAGTGVVGSIKGEKGSKVVALRADIDALPIQEEGDVPYRSQNDGVMHACGHDAHIAMLLGAAKVLWELREQFEGTVRLIFQPAEEIVQGAKKMLEEGVLEGVDSVLAIHIWSELLSGKVSLEEGPRFAAGDRFRITIKGKGSHGAMPHMGIDAIVAASAIVMSLQSIVSREIDPQEAAVISIGKIQGGENYNVISDRVVVEGTARSFNVQVQKKFPLFLERIAKNTASSFNAQAELEYMEGALPSINDAVISEIAKDSITKLYGNSTIVPHNKTTATEDFAFFLNKVPGVIAFLGTYNKAKDIVYAHHNNKFNIDDDVLPIGTSLYAQFAIDFLNKYK